MLRVGSAANDFPMLICLSVKTRLRPPFLPLALAASSPALVRSRIKSRSNTDKRVSVLENRFFLRLMRSLNVQFLLSLKGSGGRDCKLLSRWVRAPIVVNIKFRVSVLSLFVLVQHKQISDDEVSRNFEQGDRLRHLTDSYDTHRLWMVTYL
jgi:hypothetical protein